MSENEHVANTVDLASWLTGIHTFNAAVTNAASLGQLISLVASTACKLMGCNFCGVLLLREEDRRLIMEASHGFTFDYAGSLNRLYPIELNPEGPGQSPSTRAFLTAKPVVVNDVAADPLMKPWRQLAEQQGYGSLVSVPLMLKGRPFGVLNCYHRQPHRVTDSSVELLGILANQVGWAVESSHLRDLQRANIERLAEANKSLRRQSELLQKADQIHKGLNQVALQGGDIQDVAVELETLLRRSVYVDDISGQSLMRDAPASTDFDGLPEVSFSSRSSETIEASYLTNDEAAYWSITPILLAGDVVGRIWVPGQVSTLNELDLRALEEAAVIGALDILRTRTALEIEWRIHGDIMNVLLDGSPSQFESLTNRAMQLGHDLTRPHTMLVCDIQNLLGTESDVPSEAAVQLAKAAILSMRWQPKTGPLMAMRDGHLIVLAQLTEAAIEPEDLLQLGDAVRHVLNRALATRGVRVAVGAVCRKLTELTRSFKVGCGALGIHAIRRDPPCTILCPTLGLLGLLLQIDDTRQLIDFADGRMRLLREHDASRGAGLVETLERYFSNSCNFERTAQALYVHPNTVRLRIRRAETLLGVDLSTREAQIELHTAFMVDQVARATT